MIIGFDSTPLKSGHKVRGMGYYTLHLLEGLKAVGLDVREMNDSKNIPDVDIVHYPYFDLFFKTLFIRRKYPTVVTVPDVTPLLFPDHYPPGIRGKVNLFFQRRSLKKAKAIITLSDASKKDIHKILEIPNEKIFPIALAPADHFQRITDQKKLEVVGKKYQLPQKFSLYVGSVNWNKNIVNLVTASLEENIDVVLIGKAFTERNNLGHPEMRSFAEFLQKYEGHPKVHCLGFIEDQELVTIMNLATVLLFPSFYEGFGLPVLEAQAVGLPVITSKTSSLPEVSGKGALFVDPYSIQEIRAALHQVLTDKKVREQLITRGQENVSRFSWKKTVEETLDVYQKVIAKK